MKISVYGLGYIGLPTALMFAKNNINVIGIDIQEELIQNINSGSLPTNEPGLQEAYLEAHKSRRLIASVIPQKADVFIVAVPTPYISNEKRLFDYSYIINALQKIITVIENGNTIIIESTIPPGTINELVIPFMKKFNYEPGVDFYLAHCPERVLPGNILEEMINNNRIIGGVTTKCSQKATEIYKIFCEGEIHQTDVRTAEMSKLVENTFRDVNIAFANELSKICNYLNLNVLEVIDLANKHPRVNILEPGPGVGGHCLAVDPYFIVAKSPDLAKIIHLSRETNSSMPHYVAANAEKLVRGIHNPKIAVLGVTYKADVDDIRESPAMEIVELLSGTGFRLSIHDPHVNTLDPRFVSAEEALRDADLILLLTDHTEFRVMDFSPYVKGMRNRLLFDTRNSVKPENAQGLQTVNFGNLYQFVNNLETVIA